MTNKYYLLFLIFALSACVPDNKEHKVILDNADTLLDSISKISAPKVFSCDTFTIDKALEKRVNKLRKLKIPYADSAAFFYDYPATIEMYLEGDPIDYEVEKMYAKTYSADNAFYEIKKYKVQETPCSYLVTEEFKVQENLPFWVTPRAFVSYNKNGVSIDTLNISRPPTEYNSRKYPGDMIHISRDTIIHFKYYTVYSEAEYTTYLGYRAFKMLNNGVIARYFKQKNDFFESSNDSLDHFNYEKGLIINHLKHGKWTEVDYNYNMWYDFDTTGYGGRNYRKAYVEATYEHGTPVGVWEYYDLELDTGNDLVNWGGSDFYAEETNRKGPNLLMREYYENGRLVKREDLYNPKTPDGHLRKMFDGKRYTFPQKYYIKNNYLTVLYDNTVFCENYDTMWAKVKENYGYSYKYNNANVISNLKKGDKVKLLDTAYLYPSNDWDDVYGKLIKAYFKVEYEGKIGYVHISNLIAVNIPDSVQWYKTTLKQYVTQNNRGKYSSMGKTEVYTIYNTHVHDVYSLLNFVKTPLMYSQYSNYYNRYFYYAIGQPTVPGYNQTYTISIKDHQADNIYREGTYKNRYWLLDEVRVELHESKEAERVIIQQVGNDVKVTIVY